MAQLGIAVGSIVEGLEVIRRTIFQLCTVVLNCLFKSLHLSINQAAIAIDDGVLRVESDCPIEILKRLLHLTHISVAASSVVPVYGIL